jgi:hypothetical protein
MLDGVLVVAGSMGQMSSFFTNRGASSSMDRNRPGRARAADVAAA